MRVNLDVQSLRSFIKVGELRNFTRAAEALNMTQPAISQQVRRLEELLSVELFVRDNKQVLLTLEGEKLLAYAKEIVAANDKVGDLFSRRENREVVTLGMPEHFCEMVLPKIISAMAAQIPSVQIIVKVSRSVLLSESVNEGKIDIGLIIDELDRMPQTIWHALSVMWFASETSTFSHKSQIPLVLFKPPCGFRSLAIRSLEQKGISWKCAYESEDLMSLRSAVQAGVGVTVLPHLSEVKGLRTLESVNNLPTLPPFGVGLKQRDGWNPPYKREIIDLIRSVWTKTQDQISIT